MGKCEEYVRYLTNIAKQAQSIFHIDLSHLVIETNIRGTRAAIGGVLENGCPYVNANPEAIECYFDDMCQFIAPHEIAHVVCATLPFLGEGHDHGWKSICKRLGGNGEKYHNFKLSPARTVHTYMYETDLGHEIEVGQTNHSRLQAGKVDWYKSSQFGRIYASGYRRRVSYHPWPGKKDMH